MFMYHQSFIDLIVPSWTVLLIITQHHGYKSLKVGGKNDWAIFSHAYFCFEVKGGLLGFINIAGVGSVRVKNSFIDVSMTIMKVSWSRVNIWQIYQKHCRCGNKEVRRHFRNLQCAFESRESFILCRILCTANMCDLAKAYLKKWLLSFILKSFYTNECKEKKELTETNSWRFRETRKGKEHFQGSVWKVVGNSNLAWLDHSA